jgi:LCP family protein required for cell wall assembly
MSDGPEQRDRPKYTVYRSRPRFLGGRGANGDGLDLPRPERGPKRVRTGDRRPPTVGRVVKWALLALVAWVAVSGVLFLVSAYIQQSQVAGAAQTALDGGPYPLVGATTTLVIGTDERPKNSKEPGAGSGPNRSDTLMLVRTRPLGTTTKLSIPRDTVVDIPGHGRAKINAAYAIGGPALTITTVKQYLGIDINHTAEVNFANFVSFIDALGGVDYTGGCVVSKINGGYSNGGITLRLRSGTHHLTGKQALALARTRHNLCNPREDDRARARRQQKIMSAIKARLKSWHTFVRLPWVAWSAPKTIRTDMGGFSLLGMAGALSLSNDTGTRILKPSSAVTLPDGGAGLVVSQQEKQAEVRRFLNGG